ncbi:MAG: DUF3422 family protein [Allosphingosinicella sp.]
MGKVNFLGDDIFDTHGDYPRLLAGAHRRRVAPLGAPSLVRHLAFWNPAKVGPREGSALTSTKPSDAKDVAENTEPASIADRAHLADQAIVDLYKSLAMQPEKSKIVSNISTNSEVELDGRRIIILFDSALNPQTNEIEPCPPEIIPDSYRTIKINFLWHGLTLTLSFELHTEFLTLTIILDASKRFCEGSKLTETARRLHEELQIFRNLDGKTDEECKGLHSYVYYDVWDQFGAEILSPLGKYNKSLGEKFIDFRGVVLGTDVESAASPQISLPFSRDPAESGTGIEREPLCQMTEFDQLWTFIRCTQQEDTEFTVSRFLSSRAFYATALGNQPRAMLEGTGRPLCYLLYEDTLNDWQLGRLLYRVHRAGTMRIAAIMHFDALRDANELLSKMEGELESANARLLDDPGTEGEEPADDFRDWLRARHDFVEGKMKKVAELKLDGTLESRIERSRYYVKQFNTSAEALRIDRVSGFQRYDEFVTQRLGPVFEYIDSLGRKYTRVQNEKSILIGRIQTYDSQYNQETVSRAQRIADLALSCVLVPYYAAYVTVQATSSLFPEKIVWVTSLCFGIIMFIMLKLLLPVWHRMFGVAAPRFLNGLGNRYIIAALLALLSALALKQAVPELFIKRQAPPAAAVTHSPVRNSLSDPAAVTPRPPVAPAEAPGSP